ncbi:hypothetical protein JXA47_09040 [Candidatus Sumerlaeota bacterium]|nr:hypothetical protein [Candidatus Sumerlaeota bacterium]
MPFFRVEVRDSEGHATATVITADTAEQAREGTQGLGLEPLRAVPVEPVKLSDDLYADTQRQCDDLFARVRGGDDDALAELRRLVEKLHGTEVIIPCGMLFDDSPVFLAALAMPSATEFNRHLEENATRQRAKIRRARVGDLAAIGDLGPRVIASGHLVLGRNRHAGDLALLAPFGLVFIDRTPGRSALHILCPIDRPVRRAHVRGMLKKRLEIECDAGKRWEIELEGGKSAAIAAFVRVAPGCVPEGIGEAMGGDLR